MQDTVTKEKKMIVEVWSDIMCPFCYIGKRQYEHALQEFENRNQVAILWKSFQLDPSISDKENGVSAVQYLSTRKGISTEQVKEMHKQVENMAGKVGLEYKLDNAVVYNSFKAHRIIQLAKSRGLGDVAEETFFRAHFTSNKDLGDVNTLIELAGEMGLTAAEVNEALNNEEYAVRVNRDIEEARQLGVTGVPFFVFNRKYAVSGAQPADVFLKALDKSYSEWRKENPLPAFEVMKGNVCTPDGECN